MSPNCPLCQGFARVLFRSSLHVALRSDWAPLPTSAEVWCCEACGHVFKEPDAVTRWSDYDSYTAFENCADADKVSFDTGAPVTRSRMLVDYLVQMGVWQGGRVLDFGCNRGAFLKLLPRGPHAGFEVSDAYRSLIEGHGHAFHTPRDPPPRGSFEVATLLHVVEHLELPRQLEPALQALAPEGHLMVQVPDLQTQPTDVYVMDHRHHFSPSALVRALALSGCAAVAGPETLIQGELTAVFRRGAGCKSPTSRASWSWLREYLERGEAMVDAARGGGRPHVVFGAGLLGSLVARALGDGAIAFSDDNRPLLGRSLLGLPIRPLESLDPRQVIVILAVPPAAAGRVSERVRAQGFDVRIPFPAANPEGRELKDRVVS
jgi:hypothetical protein